MQEPSGENKKDNNGILSKLIDKINLTQLKLSKKEKNRRIYDDWDNDSYEIDNAHSLEDYYKNKETVFCKEDGLIEQKSLSDPRKIYGQSNQKFLQWSLITIFIFSVIGVGLYKYYFKHSHKEPYFLQNKNIQNTTNIEVENKYQANTEDIKASFKNLINEENDTISEQESDYVNDELKDISFDFSPIISNSIAKKPQLPNRVKSKEDDDTKEHDKTVSDLNSIWNTGAINSLKDETEVKTANDYLPAWRKYAIDYQPTDGSPVYSIILEYDPKVLNINELPNSSEYNIIIPGFLDYSEELSKILIEKGYEILLYLPMGEKADSLNFKAISKNSTFNDIRNIINFHTSRLNGKNFVGFMNYGQNMEVNQSLPKMNFTMSLLKKTGHLFVDNTTQNNEQSLAYAAALGQKVPTIKVNNYIEKVIKQFPYFINKVIRDGYGIAVVKATPENIIALRNYQKGIENEGVKRIPITGILKHIMLKK